MPKKPIAKVQKGFRKYKRLPLVGELSKGFKEQVALEMSYKSMIG